MENEIINQEKKNNISTSKGEILPLEAQEEEVKKILQKYKENREDPLAFQAFGMEVQHQTQNHSDTFFDTLQKNPAEEIFQEISSLVEEIKEYPLQKERGFFQRVFGKKHASDGKDSFLAIEMQMDHISRKIFSYKTILLKEIILLEEVEKAVTNQLQSIINYINAAERIHQEIERTIFDSGEEEKRKKEKQIAVLEKRMQALHVNKAVATQMLGQGMLLINSNQMLLGRVEELLTQVLPLWKNQITVALHTSISQHSASVTKIITEDALSIAEKNQKRNAKQEKKQKKTPVKQEDLRDINKENEKLLEI
ncbi:MAG: hypothetical protein GX786_02470, partial [Clostridiales bacterium]|nr:hypothetical protein [Clostridiales bacterium]